MRRLFLMLVLVSPLLVTAKPVSIFSWMIPATYDDGSPFPISELTYSKVYCGTESGSYQFEAVAMAPATSMPIEQVVSADGSYYCASTITDSKYEESAMSQEIFFTITAGEPLIRVPAAPGGFRVE